MLFKYFKNVWECLANPLKRDINNKTFAYQFWTVGFSCTLNVSVVVMGGVFDYKVHKCFKNHLQWITKITETIKNSCRQCYDADYLQSWIIKLTNKI